jgi:hypothetical protein
MNAGDVIVVLVVAAALSFDFTNGFHDTANAMATTIATGALPARWRPRWPRRPHVVTFAKRCGLNRSRISGDL